MIEATGLAALTSFLATVALIFVLRPVALRVGLVDRPDQRKWHEASTPAIGGLAILLAIAITCAVFTRLTPAVRGIGLAAGVIVVVGVADDFWRLRWPYRMGAQTAAALIMIFVGGVRVEHLGAVFGVPFVLEGPWSVALTVVATVGIINAINMIDGVDGLAAAVGLAAVLMLTAVAAYAGNIVLVGNLGFVIGALCAILVFNLRTPWNPRASIFLGNAGAELLGLIIASAAFRLTQNGHHPVGPQLAPFLVAPALIDCLTLILRRVRGGVSPFMGDRNHMHHLLLDAGLTPTWVVAIITGATLSIGALALLAMKAHTPAVLFSIAFVTLWTAYFLASRRRYTSVAVLKAMAVRLGLFQAPSRSHGARPVGSLEIASGVGAAAYDRSSLSDSED